MTPDNWKVQLHSFDRELIDNFDRLEAINSEQEFAIKYFYVLFHKIKKREQSIKFLFNWIRGLENSNFELKVKIKDLLHKLNTEELELFYLVKELRNLKLE